MTGLSIASRIYSSRQLQTWFWILLLLNILFIVWSRSYLSPLNTKEIVQFEIAKKVPVAEGILRDWTTPDDTKFQKAVTGIYFDYLFIVLYTTALAIACIYFSQLTGHQILKRAGRFFQFLIILAGICDIIENIAMLNSLNGRLNAWNVAWAYNMAVTKFSIIIVTLLFLMICLIFFSLRKIVR
ncbi:MAG: hypothetical protein H7122_15160 [Chitinophagaceae bacterium]|nr:hypothetical protein [Chitinophagaceae bacterium]